MSFSTGHAGHEVGSPNVSDVSLASPQNDGNSKHERPILAAVRLLGNFLASTPMGSLDQAASFWTVAIHGLLLKVAWLFLPTGG